MAILDAAQWEQFLANHPDAHLLQSAAWGSLKSEFGWRPVRVQVGECGVQILFRRLPFGLSIGYIPKGPVGTDWSLLRTEVDAVCRRERAIFLKIEPDLWEGQTLEETDIFPEGVLSQSIQPRRTVEIDLSDGEETWLTRMKQKTRYNLRLAQKKDVMVRETDDVHGFFQMMKTTGQRDGFGVHSQAYYQRAYDLFHPTGACALLIAEFSGQPLAYVMIFSQGRRAWYFYGASSNSERNRMPTYLIQYEAMRWAAARGCQVYDLWGIPDVEEQTLEDQFTNRNDGLWGVYRFKRGFGGEVRRSIGAWDKVFIPFLYKPYGWFRRWHGGE